MAYRLGIVSSIHILNLPEYLTLIWRVHSQDEMDAVSERYNSKPCSYILSGKVATTHHIRTTDDACVLVVGWPFVEEHLITEYQASIAAHEATHCMQWMLPNTDRTDETEAKIVEQVTKFLLEN